MPEKAPKQNKKEASGGIPEILSPAKVQKLLDDYGKYGLRDEGMYLVLPKPGDKSGTEIYMQKFKNFQRQDEKGQPMPSISIEDRIRQHLSSSMEEDRKGKSEKKILEIFERLGEEKDKK